LSSGKSFIGKRKKFIFNAFVDFKLHRLDEGRVIPLNTGFVLQGVCLVAIKGVYWTLAEICAP